jgi:anti-anti-sigma factor
MNLVKEIRSGVVIFRLGCERLDSTVAANLKAEFLMTIENGSPWILVDLSKVTYADRSGLGALLMGLRVAHEFEGDIKLLGTAPRILKLIQIARLEQHLLNYTDESKALAALNKVRV